jgi:N-acylneuraminate cytidylyltransferase
MIYYTIDAARGITSDENICVSTDDFEIKKVVEDYGLKVLFIRPAELASDTAGSRELILHAIDFYENKLNRYFSRICLLQPTSPLRSAQHIQEAQKLWKDDLDMVVSVKKSKANPYFNLFEEDDNGLLQKSKSGNFLRRQDAPNVWELNGAIYFISVHSLKSKSISDFERVQKYEMDQESSLDVDVELDFKLLNLILKQ